MGDPKSFEALLYERSLEPATELRLTGSRYEPFERCKIQQMRLVLLVSARDVPAARRLLAGRVGVRVVVD